ncbi:tyrosine-type recombinase/integrase [Paracoccus sp. NGMCC 1.201697]|uniref:Tyrosine-type recombinase/integrase n=1 Tax=Paracoccus broussonetiae subsp. drimophilus TaxID=3373869 RepID=A0ABW7LIF7_9RHOB
MQRIKDRQIPSLGEGRHFDGSGGLHLFVRGNSRTWIYRYRQDGKRRDLSLGRYPLMTLKEARIAAFNAARARDGGTDPLDAKQAAKAEAKAQKIAARIDTNRYFGRVIFDTFLARRGDLKGDGKAGRWTSPLDTHVVPVIGLVDVRKVDVDMLLRILAPIWRSKTSAAEKAYQRVSLALDHAAARWPGEIDPTIPARLKLLLGSQGHKPENIPAMPWQDVPAYYQSLGESSVDLSMRLLILSASRSAPVRLAHVDEFDGDTWTIPADKMKGARDKTSAMRIPLSEEACEVVDLARPLARDGYLFVAMKGKPISDMAMSMAMRREGLEYRPHGFRASFRSWATDHEEDFILAERALGHVVGTKVQRAYDRSDALDLRRGLMQRWSDFVTGAAG